MNLFRELTWLVTTDATTYSAYVTSIARMQAQAALTKLRIKLATAELEREERRLERQRPS